MINTVYGAFLRRLGGWTSIADLITLMGELEVDGPAVRSAISRLKKRGVLEPERRGATGYRLSPAVLPVFDEGDHRIFAGLEPADLADGWAMADPAEAFRHYVPLLTQWRRLPYQDPGLPVELLPADWNAVAARQVFRRLHAVLLEPSLRHVGDVTGLRA
ncbi:PaaX family transcriptional regulator C-terminal domain-containing protein [Streptomyces sp. NPDC054838]